MTGFFDDRPFHERSSANGFSGNPLARWSEGRDEDSLAEALGAPDVGFLLFAGESPLIHAGLDGARTAVHSHAEAQAAGLDAGSLVLLGIIGAGNGRSAPRFAGQVAMDVGAGDAPPGEDLRALAVAGDLPASELAMLAQARSTLFWHAANPFCARCGGRTHAVRGGVARFCPACAAETFPRVDPVVIMLAVNGDRCVLGRQPRFPPGMYSALAGFLEPGETIEEAVRREIAEEAGLPTARVHYHSSQAWPFPSSLMIGCHAEARSAELTPDAAELEDCRWFAREEVRAMLAGRHPDGLTVPPPMAIAHQLIAAFAEG